MTSQSYVIPHDPNCLHCTKSTSGIVVKSMCAVHRRLARMIRGSISRGLPHPTMAELEKMIPDRMVCGDCGLEMVPYVPAGQPAARRMAIQHYRNGDIAIVCHSCNSRHGGLPGDKFLEVGPDEKWCRKCDRVLKLTDFGRSAGSRGYKQSLACCKECENEYHAKEEKKLKIRAWKDANREGIREYNRAYMAVWREKNRESIREYMKAYRAANGERIAETRAKWERKRKDVETTNG